jgi:large subunit ribosomal protein L31
MKANLHPNWVECKVTCACGHTFITHAATATMQVDICNQCHPFFTGEERFVDKEGRLDKFKKKMDLSKKLRIQQQAKQANKHAKKIAIAAAKEVERLSFKQVLNQAKRENDKVATVKKSVAKKEATSAKTEKK